MRKRTSAILIALIMLAAILFCFTACDKNANDDDGNRTPPSDDDYTLTLSGLVDAEGNALSDIAITKARIKALYAKEGKAVVYTESNPCYASDKTDDDGRKIPHTLKGVYLEDILAEYTASATIDAYGSLTLYATDSYVTVATEEVFDSSGTGSKMIVAFEYDGVVLSPDAKSGALRAVFPDQIANCWAKKLSRIEFSTDVLQTPSVTRFSVVEALDKSAYYGSFDGSAEVSGSVSDCSYYGFKISELIAGGILSARPSDKTYISAWDYDSAADGYVEYGAWTEYDVYGAGYLIYERQLPGREREALTRVPVFDGPNPPFSAGMTVKNVLSLSVSDTAVVSFETALVRFGTGDGGFPIAELLAALNMYDEGFGYSVAPPSGEAALLSAREISEATVVKSGGGYVLVYPGGSVEIASVAVEI